MAKLTPHKLAKAIREGWPKAAGHSVITISCFPDAPMSWRAENAKGKQSDFETIDEALKWLGAWDG